MSLPSEYFPIPYIETTGTQWITVTGASKMSSTDRMVLDFQATDVSVTNNIAGARYTTTSQNFSFGISGGEWRFGYNTSSIMTGVAADTERHTMDMNGNVLSLDGNVICTAEAASFTAYTQPRLGAIAATSDSYTGYVKIYSCKIHKSGTLTVDLVPAVHWDGTIGMYDLVAGTFYENKGSGTFAYSITESIPAGYKPYEYIECTGTQWLDTGKYYSYGSGVSIDFEITDPSASMAVFGGRRSSSAQQFTLFWLQTNYRYDYSSTQKTLSGNAEGRKTAYASKTSCTVDGVKVSHTVSSWWGVCNLYIGAVNTNGTAELPAKMKIYACSVYANGNEVQHFIPCADENGVIGMYDCAGGAFFASAGTEEFSAPSALFRSCLINIDGVKKMLIGGYAHIAGTWKTLNANFERIDGVWY